MFALRRSAAYHLRQEGEGQLGNGADYPLELVDVNFEDYQPRLAGPVNLPPRELLDRDIVKTLDCQGRRCVPVPPRGFRPITFFLVGLVICFTTVTVFTSYDQFDEILNANSESTFWPGN